MRLTVLTLITLSVLLFAACEGEQKPQNDKGLLSTDLGNNPIAADGIDSAAYEQLPTMDFVDTLHNFGTITEGQKATYSFKFTNYKFFWYMC